MMDRAGDLRLRAAILPFSEAIPAHGDVPETPKSQRDHDHTPQLVPETSPVCTAIRTPSDAPGRSFHSKNLWPSGGMPPKLGLLVSDGICRQVPVLGILAAPGFGAASKLDPSEVLSHS